MGSNVNFLPGRNSEISILPYLFLRVSYSSSDSRLDEDYLGPWPVSTTQPKLGRDKKCSKLNFRNGAKTPLFPSISSCIKTWILVQPYVHDLGLDLFCLLLLTWVGSCWVSLWTDRRSLTYRRGLFQSQNSQSSIWNPLSCLPSLAPLTFSFNLNIFINSFESLYLLFHTSFYSGSPQEHQMILATWSMKHTNIRQKSNNFKIPI